MQGEHELWGILIILCDKAYDIIHYLRLFKHSSDNNPTPLFISVGITIKYRYRITC